MDSMNFEPIGMMHSDLVYKQESPRQGNLVGNGESFIELVSDQNFEQALEGLEEFERIWIIYKFHHNEHWKPKVNVPRKKEEKLGVFSTRSPYRPNPIGMSCVKLLKIEGRRIFVSESDLLDGSPILDIKPYVDYCDSFNTIYPDWLQQAEEDAYKLVVPEYIQKQFDYLKKVAKLSFSQFSSTQLKYEPLNIKKKRVKVLETREDKSSLAEIAYRTWRIQFELDEEAKSIVITRVKSGYSKEELNDKSQDQYGDKDVHIKYLKKFSQL